MSTVTTFETKVAMRDGVHLTTDVTVVEDGTPKPVLLVRTPYSRAGARVADDPVGLARDGWVHVAQDVRGRFESEGRFAPFEHEREDGTDTVAWCARQPWCDGTVVGWGASYLGTTQLLAAAARPPALKAISPMVTAGRFDEGWTFSGGVMATGFVLLWTAQLAAGDPKLTDKQREKVVALVADPEKLYGTPLHKHPLRKLFPPLERWLAAGHRWPEAMSAMRRRSIPGFHVAGWFDLFCDTSLDTFGAMVAGGAPQRLVVGPWSHVGLFLDHTPEETFGLDANGLYADVRGQALRFLRAAAAGSTGDLDSGARVFVTGRNRWRDLPSWPPPATPTSYWLDEGGALATTRPEGAAADHLKHDPRNPVPTRGGRIMQATLPLAGPCDQRAVEGRADVLVFTGEPVRRATTIAGEVIARVHFNSTASSADVAVKLVDVHPDGRAMSVADGIRRTGLSPGRAARAELRVGAIAHEFGPGHRIRIEVAGSNFPRFDCNPHAAEHAVLRGGRRASSVTLPVVPW